MIVENALASLAVRDLAASSKWYEDLLGPGSQPMNELLEQHNSFCGIKNRIIYDQDIIIE